MSISSFDQAQHERKTADDLNVLPFALSIVEGFLMDFSTAR
jgi:hypothetical protein